MFGFFKDKFNNLKETVSNTAQALVGNVVKTVENEEEFSEFVLDDMEDMQEFFSRDIDEIRAKLISAPKGLQQYIAFNANRYINDGTLDRVSVVRVVDEVLGTNLKMMM